MPGFVGEHGDRVPGAWPGGAPALCDLVELVAGLGCQPGAVASDLGQAVGVLDVADVLSADVADHLDGVCGDPGCLPVEQGDGLRLGRGGEPLPVRGPRVEEESSG